MSWYKNLTRREFVRIAAATAAASGMTRCSSSRTPWRFLRVSEARTLAAICDQLIPPDQDPGADWALVVNFIDIQLCGPFSEARDLYRDGIGYTDSIARSWFEKSFAKLRSDEQFKILEAIEGGTVGKDLWGTVDQRRFFEMVLSHTMQGFYGDPRHGGNRARASWKMVGLSYPQVRGRQKYDAANQ